MLKGLTNITDDVHAIAHAKTTSAAVLEQINTALGGIEYELKTLNATLVKLAGCLCEEVTGIEVVPGTPTVRKAE